MALIAPNTYRSTVSGTYAGVGFANVFDWRPVLISGALPPRSEMPGEMTHPNLWSMLAEIVERMSTLLQYTEHSWVDLDDANGPTGTTLFSPVIPGTEGGQAMPANVAGRVLKDATGGRGDRRGSFFFVGLLEAESPGTNPNVWGPAALSSWQAAINDAFGFFAEPITSASGTWRPQMVVTRTRSNDSGEAEYSGTSVVTGLQAQQRMATQRRRLTRGAG